MTKIASIKIDLLFEYTLNNYCLMLINFMTNICCFLIITLMAISALAICVLMSINDTNDYIKYEKKLAKIDKICDEFIETIDGYQITKKKLAKIDKICDEIIESINNSKNQKTY